MPRVSIKSMVLCKTVVSPVRYKWRYCSLAQSHQSIHWSLIILLTKWHSKWFTGFDKNRWTVPKWTDVLSSQDIAKSRTREIGWQNYHIALEFGRRIDSNATETPVKFFGRLENLKYRYRACETSRDLKIRRLTWYERPLNLSAAAGLTCVF